MRRRAQLAGVLTAMTAIASGGAAKAMATPEGWPNPITAVITYKAALRGAVNPNGSPTTYQFEYGPVPSFGSAAPASPQSVGSGTEEVPVLATATGLEPGTLYQFRVAVTSEGVTTYSYAREFVTPQIEPPKYLFSFGAEGSEEGPFAESEILAAAVDAEGNVWVVDGTNNCIEEFDPNGEHLGGFGDEGSGKGQLFVPFDIAIDSAGDIWVADLGNSRIEEFTPGGELLLQFGKEGSGEGQMVYPAAIDIDSEGNVWVADSGNSRVEEFTAEGALLEQFGEKGAEPGQLKTPSGIAVDSEGDVWVADTANNRIQKFSDTGEFLMMVSSDGTEYEHLESPAGMATDAEDNVWITDMTFRVTGFGPEGEFLSRFGAPGSGVGQVSPWATLTIDAEGNIWVADGGNQRVQKWSY